MSICQSWGGKRKKNHRFVTYKLMQSCKTSVMWTLRIYLQLNFYTVIGITQMGKGDNMTRKVSGHESIQKCASRFSGFVLFTNDAIHRSSAWRIYLTLQKMFSVFSVGTFSVCLI